MGAFWGVLGVVGGRLGAAFAGFGWFLGVLVWSWGGFGVVSGRSWNIFVGSRSLRVPFEGSTDSSLATLGAWSPPIDLVVCSQTKESTTGGAQKRPLKRKRS